jgi:hypothetical protein
MEPRSSSHRLLLFTYPLPPIVFSWAVQDLLERVHTDVVVTFLRGALTTTRKPIRFSFSRNAPSPYESVNMATGLSLALPVGLEPARRWRYPPQNSHFFCFRYSSSASVFSRSISDSHGSAHVEHGPVVPHSSQRGAPHMSQYTMCPSGICFPQSTHLIIFYSCSARALLLERVKS